MKICLSVVTLMLSLAFAQNNSHAFADMPWSSSREAVIDTMIARGYSINPSFVERERVGFDGRLFNRVAFIITGFDQDEKLAKVVVNLFQGDVPSDQRFDDAKKLYDNLKNQLIKKYGEPASEYGYFLSPYYAGDGYEEQAVELGKATFAAFWFSSDNDSSDSMYVEIDERFNVNVTYESPLWSSEIERRKTLQASDF